MLLGLNTQISGLPAGSAWPAREKTWEDYRKRNKTKNDGGNIGELEPAGSSKLENSRQLDQPRKLQKTRACWFEETAKTFKKKRNTSKSKEEAEIIAIFRGIQAKELRIIAKDK